MKTLLLFICICLGAVSSTVLAQDTPAIYNGINVNNVVWQQVDYNNKGQIMYISPASHKTSYPDSIILVKDVHTSGDVIYMAVMADCSNQSDGIGIAALDVDDSGVITDFEEPDKVPVRQGTFSLPVWNSLCSN